MDWEKIFANDVINKGEVPKHIHLFISSLVRNLLPNIKQIQNGVVGCAGQSLSVIIQVAI